MEFDTYAALFHENAVVSLSVSDSFMVLKWIALNMANKCTQTKESPSFSQARSIYYKTTQILKNGVIVDFDAMQSIIVKKKRAQYR